MPICPNCGQSVREGQKYCGACGANVEAARPQPASAPPGPQQEFPYAYPPSAYASEPAAPESPPPGRILIVAAIGLVAVCCALAIGIVIGLELSCYLPGNSCGAPASKPPPVSMPGSVGWYLFSFATSLFT